MTEFNLEGIPLGGKHMSGDERLMRRVLDAESKAKSMAREIKALRKDREQLLEEYQAKVMARPVPRAAEVIRASPGSIKTRVCVGDVHGMMQDTKAVAAFLADLRTIDPDEVLLGGDITECGGWLAKHQPIGFIALTDYSFQEDMNAANQFLDDIQTTAPHAVIKFLEGNHEDRVERWVVDQTQAHGRDAEFLRQLVSPEVLLRLADRNIPYYRRSVIYEKGMPRGWIRWDKMLYTHSLSYSKNAAMDAATKTAGNVTYFCTHRADQATVVFPAVGIVKAFNPGCLSLMQPVWKNSNPTNWSQGYQIEFIAGSGSFQVVHVPIWRGESLATAMIERFKS